MNIRYSSDRWLPKLVLSPTLAASLVFVYGFILITIALSFTESRLLPNWEWAGLERYEELFDNERFWVSAKNLAIFGTLFIGFSLVVGLIMAILTGQSFFTKMKRSATLPKRTKRNSTIRVNIPSQLPSI